MAGNFTEVGTRSSVSSNPSMQVCLLNQFIHCSFAPEWWWSVFDRTGNCGSGAERRVPLMMPMVELIQCQAVIGR